MSETCFASRANFEVKSIEFSHIMAVSWRSTCGGGVQYQHKCGQSTEKANGLPAVLCAQIRCDNAGA